MWKAETEELGEFARRSMEKNLEHQHQYLIYCDLMGFYGGLLGFYGIYPLVN
jgi:hypothetical protein